MKQADASEDGALQRATVYVRYDASAQAPVMGAVGEDNVGTMVERKPTLEEAYVSILRSLACRCG